MPPDAGARAPAVSLAPAPRPAEPGDEPGSLAVRTAWLLSAKALAFALAFVLPLLLVRLLSVSEFGLYKQAFLIVNTAISILPLGFVMSAFYFWPREPRRRDALVLNIVLFYALVTGIVGLALARWPELLASLFQGPELAAYGGAIGAVVFLWGTSSFLEAVAIANGETRLAAVSVVVLQLSKVLLLLGAALWSPTIGALVGAAAAQGALQLGVALAYVGSRFGRFWRKPEGSLLRAQLSYALPHGLAGLLYRIQMDLHHYFVAHHFAAAAYAVYAVGCFQLPLLAIVCESVGSVVIPRVSRLQKEGREREIVLLMAGLTRQLAALFLPFYAFLMVVHRELIAVLFTEEYLASAPIFAVNLTFVPLAVALTAGDAVIRAYAGSRFFLIKLRLLLTALTLAGLPLATERWGLLGPIAVVVAVTFLDRAAVGLKVALLVGARRSDLLLFKDVAKLALAAGAAGLVAMMVRGVLAGHQAIWVVLACGLAFAPAYLASVLVLSVPRPEEREAVLRRLRFYGPPDKESAGSAASEPGPFTTKTTVQDLVR